MDREPWLRHLAALLQNSNKHLVIACSVLGKRHRRALVSNCLGQYKIFMLNVPRETLLCRVKERNGHFVKENLVDSQLDVLELQLSNESFDVEPDTVIVDGSRGVADVINTILTELNIK